MKSFYDKNGGEHPSFLSALFAEVKLPSKAKKEKPETVMSREIAGGNVIQLRGKGKILLDYDKNTVALIDSEGELITSEKIDATLTEGGTFNEVLVEVSDTHVSDDEFIANVMKGLPNSILNSTDYTSALQFIDRANKEPEITENVDKLFNFSADVIDKAINMNAAKTKKGGPKLIRTLIDSALSRLGQTS